MAGFPDDKPHEPVIAPENITPRDTQAHIVRRNVKKPAKSIDLTPNVYLYSANPFYPPHNPSFQIPVLLLSLVKIGEGFILHHFAGTLGIVTLIPWAYFFLVACIIELREIIVARRPQVLDGEIDIIVGPFPSISQLAESRPRSWVVIGAPRNPRKTMWWKTAWVLGALICSFVTGFTYLSLAQQTNEIVMLWLMFQVLWLLGRMLVHHYAESPKQAIAHRLLYKGSWASLSGTFKKRVVNLMVALSKYIISVHPRQEYAYRDHASTPSELRNIVIKIPTMLNYPLNESLKPSDYNWPQVDIEIHSIIGDPTLISAVWLANIPGLTFENMYDTCILSLKLHRFRATSQYATIPCVRFLAGVSVSEPFLFDEETNQPLDSVPRFYPKGRLHELPCSWWYLIPATEQRWLVIRQDVLSPVLGKHSAEVMTDDRVTAILSRGNLSIDIKHVDDVKSTLENSRKARKTLTEILKL